MPDLKATHLRKHLFQVLDRAIHGETVQISYKGSILNLTPQSGGSKLARAVRRNALLVSPESIVESESEFMAGLQKAWQKDDESL